MSENPEKLRPEFELALAYTPPGLRAPLRTAFLLDQRLARIVAATKEPMLGQMRLAWWRDMLGKPIEERPTGDAVLDAIGEHWAGREDPLVGLVDGWEVVITSERLAGGDFKRYASGRAAPIIALLGKGDERTEQRLHWACVTYAFADLATGLSNEQEREIAISKGLGGSEPSMRLARDARGIAVLEALSLRALKRGGRPLMEGRGAALVTARAAIFGR